MDAHAQFRKGLTGIVGIWLTMAMMPLAELLPLTAWQLLIVRGAPGAAVFGVVILLQKGSIELPDLNLMLTAVAFMLACVGLFNAILAWGTNLSAVMLDMAVLVNFCFAVWHKKLVARASVVLFITAIIGSYLALRGWDVPNLNIAGQQAQQTVVTYMRSQSDEDIARLQQEALADPERSADFTNWQKAQKPGADTSYTSYLQSTLYDAVLYTNHEVAGKSDDTSVGIAFETNPDWMIQGVLSGAITNVDEFTSQMQALDNQIQQAQIQYNDLVSAEQNSIDGGDYAKQKAQLDPNLL